MALSHQPCYQNPKWFTDGAHDLLDPANKENSLWWSSHVLCWTIGTALGGHLNKLPSLSQSLPCTLRIIFFQGIAWDFVYWHFSPDCNCLFTNLYLLFPGGTSGKEPCCQCRRRKRHGFSPWVRKIPWRRDRQPTPVFLSAESHGWKPGGLQSTGSQAVGHDWSDWAHTHLLLDKCLGSVDRIPTTHIFSVPSPAAWHKICAGKKHWNDSKSFHYALRQKFNFIKDMAI